MSDLKRFYVEIRNHGSTGVVSRMGPFTQASADNVLDAVKRKLDPAARYATITTRETILADQGGKQ